VAKLESVNLFCSIAAVNDLELQQMDVTTAFLISPLDEEVYMMQPKGFEVKGQESKVWRLKKSIYGLKQASRVWNQKMDSKLTSMGFKPCVSDPCMYVRHGGKGGSFLIALYVDDLLLASKDKNQMKVVKKELQAAWNVKDLGEAHQFLGLTITRNRKERTMHLCQEQLLKTALVDAKMIDCNSAPTPYEMQTKLFNDSETRTASERASMEGIDYRHTVGQLQYAASNTRPDICAAVSMVSSYTNDPGPMHWKAVKRILRYIKGTLDYGIVLGGGIKVTLEGYSDADWAGDSDTRRSRTGYIFYVGKGCVTWQSKRQATVSLSTTQAEYQSLSTATQELLWIRALLKELGYDQSEPTPMHQDNMGCIELTKSNKNHQRTKHIDIRHHFIKDVVDQKQMEMHWFPTKKMHADIMTKPLAAPTFHRLRDQLNMQTSTGFVEHLKHSSKGAVGTA
jgi:hypothetical protein